MLEHHMNSDTPLWLNNTTGEAQTSRSVHICSGNRTLLYPSHLEYVTKSEFLKQLFKLDSSDWYLVEEFDGVVSCGAGPFLGGDSLDISILF